MSDAELARLLAALDEAPDALHGDSTPAVQALVALGLPALRAVLPLLQADDGITRLHAQRVLEGVSRAWVQAQANAQKQARRPALSRQDDAAWAALWQQHGSYDWAAAPALRAQAAALWLAWVEAQAGA